MWNVFSSPLSGTFFQYLWSDNWKAQEIIVFVPSLGDFFSIRECNRVLHRLHYCFRPLSRGLFFNNVTLNIGCTTKYGFRPLSRGLFFNKKTGGRKSAQAEMFSSPLSGTFFQFAGIGKDNGGEVVFVPSLGDFFSIGNRRIECQDGYQFSSPLSGTFFQYVFTVVNATGDVVKFSSPLSGTFFQFGVPGVKIAFTPGFRPLSRGLFFNEH